MFDKIEYLYYFQRVISTKKSNLLSKMALKNQHPLFNYWRTFPHLLVQNPHSFRISTKPTWLIHPHLHFMVEAGK